MYRAMVGIGVLCGLLIVSVFQITKPIIARNQAEALRQSIFHVLPEAESSRTYRYTDAGTFEPLGDVETSEPLVYAAFDAANRLTGVAIEAQGMGYQDIIRVLYGYAPTVEAIIGYHPTVGDRRDNRRYHILRGHCLDLAGELRGVDPAGPRPARRLRIGGAIMSTIPTANPVSTTDEFIKGLWKDNPVFVQVLGMCPVLAVSNTAENALAMGLATLFVLVSSNAAISALRRFIPKEVRIASYILVIATFVTVVDLAIQAISLDLHKALGAFISLIVVNCLILGRAEAFASKNTVGRSIVDGLGMGIGFTFALLCLGAVREIAGSGTLFGISLFHDNFQEWVLMILPSGGFFTLAAWLLVFNAFKQRRERADARAAEAAEVAS
jgi:electron transport complex protein RnfE